MTTNLGYFHRDDATFAPVGSASLSLTILSASLSANVSLNNTANYFDGPSVAQGTSGTWLVMGTVSVQDTTGGTAQLFAKLWDGTTVIATCTFATFDGAADGFATLAGFITSPAGNLKISVRDTTSTNGLILANGTGTGKDSTITAIRIG